jgi:hypothetical protein
MKQIMLVFIVMLLFTGLSFAQENTRTHQQQDQQQTTFLIETKHTNADCIQVLQDVNNQDREILSQIQWGCMEGNHTGYMMVEAETEREALENLPQSARRDVEVYKLTRFTPEQIESMHRDTDMID